MDLFLIIVLFLALSSPVLAIILYKIAKKNKLTVTNLSLENDNLKKERDSLTNQLIESDKKIAQAIREHSELEGRAAPYGNMQNYTARYWMQRKRLRQPTL